MDKKKSFYDVFEQESTSHLIIGNYVTEHQKASIKLNAKFLDQLDENVYKKVASRIVHVLGMYNSEADELHGRIQHKDPQREKDIKYTEKFLSLFKNPDRKISAKVGSNEEWHKDVEKLFELTSDFLVMIKDENKTDYIRMVKSNKTKLKELITSIIKEYKIKATTREIKLFIDNLNSPYLD
jgi:hypothetical protein